eukprot:1073313-Alexandrium_andersonii.AAC.1
MAARRSSANFREIGLAPAATTSSTAISSSPSALDGTRRGTGSASALSGRSRHPKGRKKFEI